MPEKKHNDLLGYVLGALSESEQEAVESQLGSDPVMARRCLRIRKRLAGLHLEQVEYDPPPGLARRTCETVALVGGPRGAPNALFSGSVAKYASTAGAASVPARPLRRIASPQNTWVPLRAALDLDTWLNALVSAAVVLVAALVVFSALGASREETRSLACEEQLHRVGIALLQYGTFQQDDLPQPLRVDPESLAGMGPSRLLNVGFVDDERWQQVAGAPLSWELHRCGEHADEGILLVLRPTAEPETPIRLTNPRNTHNVRAAMAGLDRMFDPWFSLGATTRRPPLAGQPGVAGRQLPGPPLLKALLPDGRVAPYLVSKSNPSVNGRMPRWLSSAGADLPAWPLSTHQADQFAPIVPVSQQ